MNTIIAGFLVSAPLSLAVQTISVPHVSIHGCTVEGRNYADDVSCQVVRKQGRPFRPIPAPRDPDPNDARLQDPQFMEELAWLTRQVRSCGCTCCHDTSRMKDYALWDINKPLSGPISSPRVASLFLAVRCHRRCLVRFHPKTITASTAPKPEPPPRTWLDSKLTFRRRLPDGG